MHHDSQMYYVPTGDEKWTETTMKSTPDAPASTWMVPMTSLVPSTIVEVPANWHLDDWPPFQPEFNGGTGGFVDPHTVERMWKEQFEYLYREEESFVFPMSIHPQVSGKPQVLLMHERLIEWINGFEGVEWMGLGDMAREFKAGRMGGVEVKGGVRRV